LLPPGLAPPKNFENAVADKRFQKVPSCAEKQLGEIRIVAASLHQNLLRLLRHSHGQPASCCRESRTVSNSTGAAARQRAFVIDDEAGTAGAVSRLLISSG